jgi:(R,R)-butanediol dehydrogenase / meso-butanediol dehydrogenase / diacetyl reductase
MRAAVLYAPHDLRVEEQPEPQCPGNGVVVQVHYNGLCGTDASEYAKGPLMVPLTVPHPGSGHVGPTVLGHEFIGTVVEAGPGQEGWLGRRVASGAGVWCGQCRWCLRGRTNLCARYYTLGLSTHGGLAERVAVPAQTLRVIPDSCPDLDAALAQPLAVGLHAVSRAAVQPGDRVVLLGAGAIGSFILAGLAGLRDGAGHDGPVTALDVDPGRLETARALGATETLLVDREASEADLCDLVPDGADVVIESSGVPGAAARAVAMAARGATVLLVGLVTVEQPLNLADLVLREIDVRTTLAHVCDRDLSTALGLLDRSRLASLLVDQVVPLDDVVQGGFERLVSGAAAGKLLVDPRRG